jgi:hypothetical protein
VILCFLLTIGQCFGLGISIRIHAGQNCPQQKGGKRNFMFEELSVGLEASLGA